MSAFVVVLIGAALCFAGVASLHLAVLTCGFGLGWLLSDALGTSAGTAVLIGLAGAVAAWILVSLVFRAGLFFVGAIAGAEIGARLYTLLEGEEGTIVVWLVFVLAVAFLGGWLANRWRVRVLLWLTALGGAGLMIAGLGRTTDSLDWLRYPSTGTQTVLATLAWIGLAGLGWWSQQRVSRRAIERDALAR